MELFVRTDREIKDRQIKNLNLQLATKLEIVANQDKQVDLLKNYNKELQEEIEKRKTQNYYWAAGGVLGGILLTSLAISAAKR